jgi:hypothetical protein
MVEEPAAAKSFCKLPILCGIRVAVLLYMDTNRVRSIEIRPSPPAQRLLDALRTRGSLHLDLVPAVLDASWGEAFLLVDRLSRSRHIALHRTESREYLVSIARTAPSTEVLDLP